MKSLSVTLPMKATQQYFPVVFAVDYAVQSGSQSIICKTGYNPKGDH